MDNKSYDTSRRKLDYGEDRDFSTFRKRPVKSIVLFAVIIIAAVAWLYFKPISRIKTHDKYVATELVGGCPSCLDAIDVDDVKYGSKAQVFTESGHIYHYEFINIDANEDLPIVIKPDKNGDRGRWILNNHGDKAERPPVDTNYNNVIEIKLSEYPIPVKAEIIGWAIQYEEPGTRQTVRQWFVPPECTGCKWVRETPAGENPKFLRKVKDKVLEDMN